MGSSGPPQARTWGYYFLSLAAVAGATILLGWGTDKTRAALLFTAILAGALFFWTYRLAFAFFGLATMLLLGVLDVQGVVEFAGLDIVLFLVGMMILIGFLEDRRFFEHVVDGLVGRIGTSGRRLTLTLMGLAAVSAALVDEVTSILFMAATVFNITSRLQIRPLPLLMMVVFATNIGSSATVVGNPVGVMIALRAGLTFSDFLRWATPIAVLALLLVMGLCLLVFRRYIRDLDTRLCSAEAPVTEAHAQGLRDLWLPSVLFGSVILALVLHKQIESWFGLEKNAMLLGSALYGAAVALLLTGQRARELVERRVDWWTLAFFLALFASVGALQLSGVTGEIADGVLAVAGDDPRALFVAFMGVAAVLSALMDNVLAVAMFIPVVADLGAAGQDAFPLWWAMLFAGTFFGNLTMMGSTANIIAIGMVERRGLDHVTFWGWLCIGAVVSVPTLLLAMGLLYVQFYL